MYSSLISSNDASSCSTIADTVGSLYATRFRADEDDGAVQKGRERSPGRWKRDGDGRYTDVEVRREGPCTTVAASGGVSLPPSVVLALVAEAPVVVLKCLLEVTRHRRAEAETTPVEHARRRAQESICRIVRRCKEGGKWQTIGCFLALVLTQWQLATRSRSQSVGRRQGAWRPVVLLGGAPALRTGAADSQQERTERRSAKGPAKRRKRGPTIGRMVRCCSFWTSDTDLDTPHFSLRSGRSTHYSFHFYLARKTNTTAQQRSAAL